MRKPLYEWINEIHNEEIKEALRDNIVNLNINPDGTFSSLAGAIDGFTSWSKTKEGSSYWYDIYKNARQGDI